MARNRLVKTDMFVAISDSGERFRIVEYTEMVQVQAMGKLEELPGLIRLMTTDHLPVKKISDADYEIVESGVIVTRAPLPEPTPSE